MRFLKSGRRISAAAEILIRESVRYFYNHKMRYRRFEPAIFARRIPSKLASQLSAAARIPSTAVGGAVDPLVGRDLELLGYDHA